MNHPLHERYNSDMVYKNISVQNAGYLCCLYIDLYATVKNALCGIISSYILNKAFEKICYMKHTKKETIR